MPAEPLGLRERKKQQTREVIAEQARRLFEERGFERVTVAEKTVFNYFPTKEDLFYHRMERFEDELLGAIRTRAAGETVLEAFGRFVLTPRGAFAPDARDAGERLHAINRTITSSPALLAREREVFERYTESLATLIAEETGAAPDDVEPRVAAGALMSVHRELIQYVRTRTVAGAVDPARLAGELRAHGQRALARLEAGLGGYAVKP